MLEKRRTMMQEWADLVAEGCDDTARLDAVRLLLRMLTGSTLNAF